MHDRFESLESGEVISVQHDTHVLGGHRTFRVGELSQAIEGHLKSAIANWSEENNGWFTPQGTNCEALRFGSKGWQKGRIRLCLEFCPDEPDLSATAMDSSIPAPVNSTTNLIGQAVSPPSIPANAPIHPTDVSNASSREPGSTAPLIASNPIANTPEIASTMPIAGIAAMGTVAVATAVVTSGTPSSAIPHHEDTTLETEGHHSDPNSGYGGALEEIAFDFDSANNDLGIMASNGMMELDLTDLSLDFAEHDLLSFETSGMSGDAEEFINLQDLGKSENSGILIDEVWNEMNQGNWPGIN